MSVAHHLDLEDDTQGLLAQAHERWDHWATQYPALRVVGGLPGLRDWLRSTAPEQTEEVLRALAALAAPDCGDDPAAAATLAWCLLPGACALANRLRTLSARIDEIVAAQLWVEVRTFGWDRPTKVASGILMNTRAGVLRECGARIQVQRVDPTWSRTIPVDPSLVLEAWSTLGADPGTHTSNSHAVDGVDAGDGGGLLESTAADELLDLLEWACDHEVISGADRILLLCLVDVADPTATTRTGRGWGGLLATSASERVAQRLGIGQATVRRRARRSIRVLAAASSAYPMSA